MSNIERLVNELVGISNHGEIVKKLQKVASEFLLNYHIEKNGVCVFPFEIEMYYYSDCFKDGYTHRADLQKEYCKIYVHSHGKYKCFDLCVAPSIKGADCYLSILLRGGIVGKQQSDKNEHVIIKPSELYNAFIQGVKNYSTDVVIAENSVERNSSTIMYSQRVGLSDNCPDFKLLPLRAVLTDKIADFKGLRYKEELVKSVLRSMADSDEKALLKRSHDLIGYNMRSAVKEIIENRNKKNW